MIAYMFVLLIMLITFINLSKKTNRLINLSFFIVVNFGLMMILPNIVRLYYNNNFLFLRKGDYILIFYFLIITFGVFIIEKRNVNFKCKNLKDCFTRRKICSIIIFFLVFYWIKNFSIIKLALSNPRMFYANTRLGGGLIYYLIIPLQMFLYFCYITSLKFSEKTRYLDILKIIIASSIVILITYIFGQKSGIVLIAYLLVTTISFKYNFSNKNKVIIVLGLLALISFTIIFSLYSSQQLIKFDGILKSFAQYSDYIENFNDLVDNLDSYYYGNIFFENEIISYIPRMFWPNKPELFGSLKLGLIVPRLVKWTLSLTGAPSFGPIGAAYADFGLIGVIIHAFAQLFLFMIAKNYENKLSNYKPYNFWYHFLYLTFSGTLIFYVTLQSLPIYQLLIIFIIYNFCSNRRMKEAYCCEISYQRYNSCK